MVMPKSKQQEIVQFSPQKLLAGFEHGGIIFWIIVAVVIHIVFIGATSLGYIRDTWVDPEGAKKRKEQAALIMQQKEAAKTAAKEVATAAATEPAAAPKPAAAGEGGTAAAPAGTAGENATAATAGTGGSDDKAKMDAIKNTPMGKTLTDTAKPSEIPKQPDLGIPLDDTNKP